MPLPLTSLPSASSCPEYLTSFAPPLALRNAYNYLATCIWVNFHYFSSHRTCIGWMERQAPSSCKSQHRPLLKISAMCQNQPRCFGFSQQWAWQWRMSYLYLTGKLENYYLYPQGYISKKNIWAFSQAMGIFMGVTCRGNTRDTNVCRYMEPSKSMLHSNF